MLFTPIKYINLIKNQLQPPKIICIATGYIFYYSQYWPAHHIDLYSIDQEYVETEISNLKLLAEKTE